MPQSDHAADSAVEPRALSVLRVASVAALAGYPLGALVRLLFSHDGPGPALADVVGFGLMILALIGFAILSDSQFQKMTQRADKALDERERRVPDRASHRAYSTLSATT